MAFLLPKEHGAYGQIAFPLITSAMVAGLSIGGALVMALMLAGFLAHEPASVLLGLRGPRAARERGSSATRWLAACAIVGLVSVAAAVVVMPSAARWALAMPLVPAAILGTLAMKGREKSWPGEVAASLAFSGAAVPVCVAAGKPVAEGIAVMIPFALLFVAGTLAVRVVILRVRGGGDPRATAATRTAAFALSGGAIIALGGAALTHLLPWSVLLAAAPGLATAAAVAARPPSPTALRTLGWTLVAVSVATAGIVVYSSF